MILSKWLNQTFYCRTSKVKFLGTIHIFEYMSSWEKEELDKQETLHIHGDLIKFN